MANRAKHTESQRWGLNVLDSYQDHVAVVDPLNYLVDVLLELMRSPLLQLLVDEDVDRVLGSGAESLTDAAVVRQGIIAANFRVLGQFAGHARAIQRTAPEFEDESLHGNSLYAGIAPEAETEAEPNSFRRHEIQENRMNSAGAKLSKTAFPGKMNGMIVTIDGPAGAGKSTVARALARRLGCCYLDTGAMYRAVALAGLQAGVDWNRPEQLAELAATLDLRVSGVKVYLQGEDVTGAVRSQVVTSVTRHAANHPQVRSRLVLLQRAVAAGQDVVTEGRDQGTVVFPQAECKIFLTASPEERARRRQLDLQQRGESATLEEILAAQARRDHEDATRPIGPLCRAEDAVEVLTDGLTQEQVVDRLEELVRSRMPN
jgi:cytidylate kinase